MAGLRMLLRQAAACLGEFSFTNRQVGPGLFQGEAEVAWFKADQQITWLHMLIILHVDLFDTRGELAGNPCDFTLYIGVVGVFVMTTNEIPLSEEPGCNQQYKGNEDDQSAFQLGGHGVARWRS